jgi:DNA-binding IclR family transcriptional regulator
MNKSPRGIQSLEVGGTLLQALAHAGRPLPLKDLAARAGMSAAKAHPYLVSWCRVGLVAQDEGSGRYGLGPMAMHLGLISLQQHDPVRLASAQLEPLALATNCTVALTLWGNAGPTVVRVVEAPSPLHVSLRHGTVLNLHQTASGQAMAAWRAPEEVQALWQQGMTQAPSPGDWAAFQQRLKEVRATGYAHSDETLLPGVAALAVPGCDAWHIAQWALVAVAPRSQWPDETVKQSVVGALCAATERVRRQLGWLADAPPQPVK